MKVMMIKKNKPISRRKKQKGNSEILGMNPKKNKSSFKKNTKSFSLKNKKTG